MSYSGILLPKPESARIALVHLSSFGDCLYSTLVARQIKRDYPGCRLTWHVGDRFASVLDLNPHVDEIRAFPIESVRHSIENGWFECRERVEAEISAGRLDLGFFTQILPENVLCYDGTIRGTIYGAYPGSRIEGPHRSILRLRDSEIEAAASFAKQHKLADYKQVFLFECGPKSGQSSLTPDLARAIASELTARHSDIAFVLSSSHRFSELPHHVYDGSPLTIRETAALTHHCTALIGCSSGITWAACSEAGKLLPSLQILSASLGLFHFASVHQDWLHYGLPANLVMEMYDPSSDRILNAVHDWLASGFDAAFKTFHETRHPDRRSLESACAAVPNSETREQITRLHVRRWPGVSFYDTHAAPSLWRSFTMVWRVGGQTTGKPIALNGMPPFRLEVPPDATSIQLRLPANFGILTIEDFRLVIDHEPDTILVEAATLHTRVMLTNARPFPSKTHVIYICNDGLLTFDLPPLRSTELPPGRRHLLLNLRWCNTGESIFSQLREFASEAKEAGRLLKKLAKEHRQLLGALASAISWHDQAWSSRVFHRWHAPKRARHIVEQYGPPSAPND